MTPHKKMCRVKQYQPSRDKREPCEGSTTRRLAVTVERRLPEEGSGQWYPVMLRAAADEN